MPTSLLGISKKAESEKQHRFANLFGLLTPSMLKETWRGIRKSAAAGVDRVDAKEYEKQLKENVENLVDRLKRKSYRARLIRRRLIPKGNGKMRPLGIPVVEDKLLQLAVAKILEAIYEEDFLRCSYGYRPEVGAQDAVDKLTVKLQFGRYGWVVEADIKGFLDTASHCTPFHERPSKRRGCVPIALMPKPFEFLWHRRTGDDSLSFTYCDPVSGARPGTLDASSIGI